MIAFAALGAMLLLLAGCDGPATPSAPEVPLLQGILLGGEAARGVKIAVPGKLPRSTSVESDGTFSLGSLPIKSFTAEFTRGVAVLGRQEFRDVAADHQITITVDMNSGEALLLDERRLRVGEKEVETLGTVRKVLALDPTADSHVEVDLWVAVVRAGVTKVVRGGEILSLDEVKAGQRVRLKGEWSEGSMIDVLAAELEVLREDDRQGLLVVCHESETASAAKRTLTIGTGAWSAHKTHGDRQGPCA